METSSTQRLKHLYNLQISGKGTEAEYTELLKYFNDPLYVSVIDVLMDKSFEESGGQLSLSNLQRERVLGQILTKPVNLDTTKKSRLWPRLTGIAAAVAAITLGVWLYYISAPSRSLDDSRDLLSYADDIKPGGNKATITLANGQVIDLNAQKSGVVIGNDLKYSDGTALQSLASDQDGNGSQMLTARTPRGGTYEFTLPDGSKAWLNAGSKLEFASDLGKANKRTVELEGEVYLEVAKDKARPFVVKTKYEEIEVLGTHFNVNAYSDEAEAKTTLMEGSVRVNQKYVLKPGQQSVSSGHETIIQTADLDQTLAWKEGFFRFESEEFSTIMNKIARWYDVEIEYEGGEANFQAMSFGGFVSRSKNLSAVLAVFEQTERVHFTLEGRKVIVRKFNK